TVSFDGTLKATGNRDTHGGTITLTLGAGGLTVLPGANVIDLTGARLAGISPGGGGTFSVFSDGDITLGGPDIVVDGTTTDAERRAPPGGRRERGWQRRRRDRRRRRRPGPGQQRCDGPAARPRQHRILPRRPWGLWRDVLHRRDRGPHPRRQQRGHRRVRRP